MPGDGRSSKPDEMLSKEMSLEGHEQALAQINKHLIRHSSSKETGIWLAVQSLLNRERDAVLQGRESRPLQTHDETGND